MLTPAAATCSCLHKWVRGKVSCVEVRHPDELSGLATKDWPSLLGVLDVLQTTDPHANMDLKRLLQGKWHAGCSSLL